MKQTGFMLMMASILFLVSCTPEENAADSDSKSKPAVKTEVPPRETLAEPAPAAAEREKAEIPTPQNPVVKMITNKGEIDIELYADKAPITVENFLSYVKSGFYNGTIFHRVIPRFMIQGGGMTADLQPKPTRPPIKNESTNKLRNQRGTIAMARQTPPDTATSQFFINLVDNRSLDFDGPYAPGYAVFGKVTEGMDVVDRIAAIPTQRIGPHEAVPIQPVIIESVTVMK